MIANLKSKLTEKLEINDLSDLLSIILEDGVSSCDFCPALEYCEEINPDGVWDSYQCKKTIKDWGGSKDYTTSLCRLSRIGINVFQQELTKHRKDCE